MAAQFLVAAGQIGAGILVEIAECGRQAVGAPGGEAAALREIETRATVVAQAFEEE